MLLKEVRSRGQAPIGIRGFLEGWKDNENRTSQPKNSRPFKAGAPVGLKELGPRSGLAPKHGVGVTPKIFKTDSGAKWRGMTAG